MTTDFDLLGEIASFTPITPPEEAIEPEPILTETFVIRDVCLGSGFEDHSPERMLPANMFNWDHSPERSSKRMKYADDVCSMGSHCSSPAMSDVSENEESTSGLYDFSVPRSFQDIFDAARENTIFEEFNWMEKEAYVAPPAPAKGTLPWEGRWTSCPRKITSRRNSSSSSTSSSNWTSNKKWSQLNVSEQREAINSLMQVTEDLGLRERLDIKHILNINPNRSGPIVIDLNTLNDDKWRQIKLHIRKSLPNSSKETKSDVDHVYPSQRKQPCPLPPKSNIVTKEVCRNQTSGHSSTDTQMCKIKPRKQVGARRHYKTSANSLLRKDILNKITESASRGTVGMKLAMSDVREAVSGLFREEEKIVISSSTQEVDVDILG